VTTITRGQVLAAADHHRIDRHEALKLVSTLGIAITEPEPPEAMAKLAWLLVDEVDANDDAERDCRLFAKHVAIAALQHVEKAVRGDEREAHPRVVEQFRANLLTAIGAKP
jgi:hypothetical protein